MCAQHDHYDSKCERNLGELICLFPLRKRKQNRISRFSFEIVSVRMVTNTTSIFLQTLRFSRVVPGKSPSFSEMLGSENPLRIMQNDSQGVS